MEKTKKPIGFNTWEIPVEDAGSSKEEKLDYDELYEKKIDDYQSMMDDLIEEVSHGYKSFLTEKKKRLVLEMDILDLKKEIEGLKSEIEALKKEKEAEK